MSARIDDLQKQFGGDGVQFKAGRNGLAYVELSSSHGLVEIYLHGAHVTRWKPAGGDEALFMSHSSAFADGKPIRGGVPICFPWFGPRDGDPDAPAHGFARLRAFDVERVARNGSDIAITLRLDSDAQTRRWWYAEFSLRHTITLGRSLAMQLQFENRGSSPAVFEEALHTYFAVADIRQVRVGGLQGVHYLSKVEQKNEKQLDAFITFTRETDRVFRDTPDTCTIEDGTSGRRFTVEKQGSQTTVVWNPWIDKARRMEDFDDDRWPEMVCVETANTANNRVTVLPGQSHVMSAVLTVA